MKKLTIICVLLFITFSACSTATPPSVPIITAYSTDSPPVTSEAESIALLSRSRYQLTETGFFIGGTHIAFHDFASTGAMVVCIQPGCTHTDALCMAFIGTSAEYAFYRDTFYVMQLHDVGLTRRATFKARAATDNIWTVLWEYDFTPHGSRNVSTRLGGGYAVIAVNEFINEFGLEEVEDDVYSTNIIAAINLETQTVVDIIPRRRLINYESFLLVGADKGKAVIMWTGFESEVLNHLEYMIKYMEQDGISAEEATDNWFISSEAKRINRIAVLDLETGVEVTLVEGRPSELFLHSFNVVHQGILYYVHNQTVYAYSLQDGTTEALFNMPNIGGMSVLDGRIFYTINSMMVEGHFSFHYYIIETGEHRQLNNEGNREYWVYSLHSENGTKFFGFNPPHGHFIIPKEDFYNEYFGRVIWID